MKTKCLIVDDEPLAIEVIENHISHFENLEVTATARSAIRAFEILEQEKVDLIFLDIQMPQLTGIEFLKTLTKPPVVIFTTAYIDYALESYELDVLDYLVKPISFPRFLKAVNKYFALGNRTDSSDVRPKSGSDPDRDHLFVRADRKSQKVKFDDILYVESVKDYVKIHCADRRILVKTSLSAFEEELPAENFVRIHRSYILNLDQITAYTAYDIEIGSIEIPIGVSYKQKVFERLK